MTLLTKLLFVVLFGLTGYAFARWRYHRRMRKLFGDVAAGRVSEEELFVLARRDSEVLRAVRDSATRDPVIRESVRRHGLL